MVVLKSLLQCLVLMCFEILLNVEEKIVKQDTSYRSAVPVKERFVLTLWFLAIGDSYHNLMY